MSNGSDDVGGVESAEVDTILQQLQIDISPGDVADIRDELRKSQVLEMQHIEELRDEQQRQTSLLASPGGTQLPPRVVPAKAGAAGRRSITAKSVLANFTTGPMGMNLTPFPKLAAN